MVVKQLNLGPGGTCSCGSWLDHWDNHGRPSRAFRDRRTCAVLACEHPIAEGGLVQKEVLEGLHAPGLVGDRTWYVVPLCHACARQTGARFRVEEDCGLVSINPEETCGGLESTG